MNHSRAHGRPVLAAIEDSALAVSVARRAARLAREQHRPLVLLIAVPFDLPGGGSADHLVAHAQLLRAEAEVIAARVRPALGALGLHARLIVRPYRDRGGPRRTAARIAAELVRTAAEEDAHTLVLGLPDRRSAAGAGVLTRITRTAPPDVHLAFAVDETRPAHARGPVRAGYRTQPLGPPGLDLPAARLLPLPEPSRRPVLTPMGRQILTDRAYRLRSVALPHRRATLNGPIGELTQRLHRYELLVAELRRLDRLLTTAASTTDRAPRPGIIEVGDHVQLRAPDGSECTILLVEAFEAAFNPAGVSVDSPLARALLHREIGAQVNLPGNKLLSGRRARLLACWRNGTPADATPPGLGGAERSRRLQNPVFPPRRTPATAASTR